MRRLLPLLILSGCSVLRQSDRAFAANSAAARIYHESRYEKVCVVQKGPATCLEFQRALQDLKAANEVADAVVKVGAMPAQEKAELATLLAKIQAYP